jgi:AcrR family transcriptional regulator
MVINRRTQAERSAATRDALVTAARALFGARGYAGVGTEEVVRAAGVSRGALYHQFADKTELFAAVFEAVEVMTNERIVAAVTAAGPADPVQAMQVGIAAFLDLCTEPEMARIMLLDAPAVLGTQRWSDISYEHNMGLVQALITEAIEAGRIPRQPVMPLAHVLMGALREAALYLATAPEVATARAEVGAVMSRMLDGLALPAG